MNLTENKFENIEGNSLAHLYTEHILKSKERKFWETYVQLLRTKLVSGNTYLNTTPISHYAHVQTMSYLDLPVLVPLLQYCTLDYIRAKTKISKQLSALPVDTHTHTPRDRKEVRSFRASDSPREAVFIGRRRK